jgi:NADH dehydrogenase/NADH:ubiquinone oxidoreductase subunit G
MKIQIIIDGHMVQVEKGTPVLNAARNAGVVIPTLCYHEGLRPYGGCRLCMVEVVQNKQRRLVTSCNLPAEAGMEVFTETEPVKQVKRNVVELLLARCSEVPMMQEMAKRMGIETSGLKNIETKDCILCGLCVRFCEEVVGVSAIGLSNRGTEREVTTPFKAASETCIGCGSCTYICPTGCIEMMLEKRTPTMHTMRIGKLSHEPCLYDYRCETCEIEKKFIDDMKNVVIQFRNKFIKTG